MLAGNRTWPHTRRMPDKLRLTVALASAPLLLGALTACGSGHASSASSCAARFRFHDQVYTDVGNVKFKTDAPLGEGTMLSCDDTGGGDDPVNFGKLNAYAIHGVDVADAVAVGESLSDAAFYVREGMSPKDVKALIRAGG